MEPRQLSDKIIELLHKYGANTIQLFEVTEDTSYTDFEIFASGRSTTHVKSLADNLEFELKQGELRGVEGREEGSWILMDYLTVIVHIFLPDVRSYYNIERLQNLEHEININEYIKALEEGKQQ